MDQHNLPFEVNQLVETRSFTAGFRGAWFRCKILDIRRKTHEMSVSLEYLDFPDEKIEWIEVYEKVAPTGGCKRIEEKRELMVRPSYPRVSRQSQIPDSYPLSEELVIVRDTWKIGDLVDWWKDDCYWSGRVTRILDVKKVKIELPPPPLGEGETYDAFSKDLRPSLNWSVIDGWTMPSATGVDKSNCGWLLKPATLVLAAGQAYDFAIHLPREGRKKIDTTAEKEAIAWQPSERSSINTAPNQVPTPVIKPILEKGPETSPRALLEHSPSPLQVSLPSQSEVKPTLEAAVPFKKGKVGGEGGTYDFNAPATKGGKKPNMTVGGPNDRNLSNPSRSLSRSLPPKPSEGQPKETRAPVLGDHSQSPIRVSEDSLPPQSETKRTLEAAESFKRRKVDGDLVAGHPYDLSAPGPKGGGKKLSTIVEGPNDRNLSNPSRSLPRSLPPKPSEGQPKETLAPVLLGDHSQSPIRVSKDSLPPQSETKRTLEAAESFKRRKVDGGHPYDLSAPGPKEGGKKLNTTVGGPNDHNLSNPSRSLPSSERSEGKPKETPKPVKQEISEGKPITAPSETVTPVIKAEGEVETSTLCQKVLNNQAVLVKDNYDTVKAAVVDLEELLNRIKWAKKVWETGTLSNTAGPSWKFVDPPTSSSTPK